MAIHSQQDFSFAESAEEQRFDVKTFLYRYLHYWYWFVISLALCVLAAYLYLRYTVPQYEASAKLLIKDQENTATVSEEAVLQDLGLGGKNADIMSEVEILKSRTLMMEVVKELNLQIQYFAQGRLKNTELFGQEPFKVDTAGLNSEALAGRRVELRDVGSGRIALLMDDDVSKEYFYGDEIPLGDAEFTVIPQPGRYNDSIYPIAIQFGDQITTARSYANRIEINRVGEASNVLQLRLVDFSGDKAEAVINTLIKKYNEATIDDKNRVGKNTLSFIEERLEFLTVELAAVEGELERYKSGNDIGLELSTRAEIVLDRITEYERSIAELETQRELSQALLNQIIEQEDTDQLLPLVIDADFPQLNAQVEEYNDLVLERDRIRQTAGTQNPLLLQITEQISGLRTLVIQNLNTYLSSIEREIQKIEQKYSDLRSTLSGIPQAERELLERKRQQIIKENLFLYLLEKREETALSLAVTTPNSRLVDPALALPTPVVPVPFNIYALAIFLGFGFPVVGIISRQILDDKIRSEDDITDYSDVPIAGSVNIHDDNEKIVVNTSSRSAIAEMFRLLRTNLRFMLNRKGNQTHTILVTSMMAGEGKTFITVNLGVTMAISNMRTLLIGLDLRKPKLGTYLGKEDVSLGISNFVVDDTILPEDVIRPSEFQANLDFVSSGPIPPNPAELVMTDRLGSFFEYARKHYDCILIDTPPVGLVTDAFLINQYVTNSLFVVRIGKSRKSTAEYINKIYKEGKLSGMACVMNGLSEKRGAYGYGYGDGYGYYDDENLAKKPWWKIRNRN